MAGYVPAFQQQFPAAVIRKLFPVYQFHFPACYQACQTLFIESAALGTGKRTPVPYDRHII